MFEYDSERLNDFLLRLCLLQTRARSIIIKSAAGTAIVSILVNSNLNDGASMGGLLLTVLLSSVEFEMMLLENGCTVCIAVWVIFVPVWVTFVTVWVIVVAIMTY